MAPSGVLSGYVQGTLRGTAAVQVFEEISMLVQSAMDGSAPCTLRSISQHSCTRATIISTRATVISTLPSIISTLPSIISTRATVISTRAQHY